MRKTDHLNGITTFVITARLGSFTAAAEQLGLTKSAVGKSVTRLEDRLGIKLFHRSTRNLSLTDDGERYLASCQYAIEILEHAEAEATAHIKHPSGRLRIDVPAAFGRQRILPLLLKITQDYPSLTFTITFSERFVDVIEEGIDLVVRIGELSDSSGLVARRLTTQKLVICASKEYLSSRPPLNTIEDIANHACVVGIRRDQPIAWLLKEADKTIKRIIPPPTFEISDGEAMLHAVLAGNGISQLPRWLVDQYLNRGELVEVLTEYAGAEMPISAIWPKSRHMLPKIRYMVDSFVEAAQTGRFD